jgi:hypothetical protein
MNKPKKHNSLLDVKIKTEYPPNIEKIRDVLPLSGKEIFAWDGTIYNPGKGGISDALIEHERTHFKQQNGDPEAWWDQYLIDPEFRFAQELEAHQAEYRAYCKSERNRNKRARYLFEIAARLASPMYNCPISQTEAMKYIKSNRSL